MALYIFFSLHTCFPESPGKWESSCWSTGRSHSVWRDSATSPAAPTRSQGWEGCRGNVMYRRHMTAHTSTWCYLCIWFVQCGWMCPGFVCINACAFKLFHHLLRTFLMKRVERTPRFLTVTLQWCNQTSCQCWVTVFNLQVQQNPGGCLPA